MTSISKNIFISILYDILNKYDVCHGTIKMKPVDVKSSTYIDFNETIIKKILNLKLVIM